MQVRLVLEALGTAAGPPAVPDESRALLGSVCVPDTGLSSLRELTHTPRKEVLLLSPACR